VDSPLLYFIFIFVTIEPNQIKSIACSHGPFTVQVRKNKQCTFNAAAQNPPF
jgi:hypothetical protein